MIWRPSRLDGTLIGIANHVIGQAGTNRNSSTAQGHRSYLKTAVDKYAKDCRHTHMRHRLVTTSPFLLSTWPAAHDKSNWITAASCPRASRTNGAEFSHGWVERAFRARRSPFDTSRACGPHREWIDRNVRRKLIERIPRHSITAAMQMRHRVWLFEAILEGFQIHLTHISHRPTMLAHVPLILALAAPHVS